jgi:hypothetical protein
MTDAPINEIERPLLLLRLAGDLFDLNRIRGLNFTVSLWNKPEDTELHVSDTAVDPPNEYVISLKRWEDEDFIVMRKFANDLRAYDEKGKQYQKDIDRAIVEGLGGADEYKDDLQEWVFKMVCCCDRRAMTK